MAIALLPLMTLAQTSTKSPYSYYGLGDVEPMVYAENAGMGGLKYALGNPYQLNAANPALLSSLDMPTFTVGAIANSVSTNGNEQSQTNTNAYFKYFGLGLPLGGRFSLGLGLTPYTKMGYAIEQSTDDDELGEVQTRYEGEGGINRAYLNLAYVLLQDSTNNLSLGLTPSYYFGTTNRSSNILFAEANAYNTVSEQKLTVSDVNFEIGVNYKKLLHKDSHGGRMVSLGAVYGLQRKMNAKRSDFAYTTSSSGASKDTVINESSNGRIVMPQSLGVGIVYEFYSDSTGKWDIGLDYGFTSWSDLSVNGENQDLNDRHEFALGASFLPDERAIRRSFLKTITYRAGVFYYQNRLNLGDRVDEYGMSIGMGIPLIGNSSKSAMRRNTSMINFALQYGQRGINKTGLIQERYVNFLIGFTFTPDNRADKWFERRKIE